MADQSSGNFDVRKTRNRLFQGDKVAWILAIVGIAVAVYLAVRSERTKSLVVERVVARPLVNKDTPKADDISVMFAGTKVGDPWLLTLRIVNTGSAPIEAGDIEKPLEVSIEGATLLRSDVASRSPDNVVAGVSIRGNTVAVSHGLLNPSDAFTLDILTDGTPGALAATCRISGVRLPEVRTVAASAGTPRQTILSAMPSTLVPVILVFGSFAALLFVIVGIAFVAGFIARLRRDYSAVPQLRATIARRCATSFAARDKDAVARHAHALLPQGLDELARKKICSLAEEKMSPADFEANVRRILSEVTTPPSGFWARWRAADPSELGAAFLVAAVGLPAIIVMIAAWQEYVSR